MPNPAFSRCVFINCPLDEDYEPVLQAILFCIVYLGYSPRLATESLDSGENRLEKIRELIKSSQYSIHDLSRCQAADEGEFFRLNMPFELGIDYGCRHFYGRDRRDKKFLILEEKKYRYQAAISDISGCDIAFHRGEFDIAVRKVRNWLVSEARIRADGTAKILGAYDDFQEWNFERLLAQGFSEEDVLDYPTIELLDAMRTWIDEGKPI